VRADVLHLCEAGAHVRLVRDAVAGIDAGDTQHALAQMLAAGARLVTTAEVVESCTS
jgi:nicotinamidase-related amidase